MVGVALSVALLQKQQRCACWMHGFTLSDAAPLDKFFQNAELAACKTLAKFFDENSRARTRVRDQGLANRVTSGRKSF